MMVKDFLKAYDFQGDTEDNDISVLVEDIGRRFGLGAFPLSDWQDAISYRISVAEIGYWRMDYTDDGIEIYIICK